MLILHGENTVQSRNRLIQVLDQARAAGKVVTHIDAKNLSLGELERALGSTSLFAEPQVIVLEELHSLPKSKRRDELIAFVGQAQQQLEAATELILWEKRPLTAPMLGKFTGAKQESFALTKSLFAWLDSLVGTPNDRQRQQMLKLLRATLESDGDVMCLVMLARQVRLLLELSDGGGQGIPPFMAGKLRRQLQTFTEQQLLQLHRKLLELDLEQKTTRPPLSLAAQLELLLATM